MKQLRSLITLLLTIGAVVISYLAFFRQDALLMAGGIMLALIAAPLAKVLNFLLNDSINNIED